MGDPIRLTNGPTRITVATKQAAKDALDVTAYKGFDLFLVVYEIAGGSPGMTVNITTSMQNVSDDAALWLPLGSAFTTVTTANTAELLSITSGSLRYIRWEVSFPGTTASTTFELTGIARPG